MPIGNIDYTQYVMLMRPITGGQDLKENFPTDAVVAILGNTGYFGLTIGTTAPTNNTDVWLDQTGGASTVQAGVPKVYDASVGNYVPMTPQLRSANELVFASGALIPSQLATVRAALKMDAAASAAPPSPASNGQLWKNTAAAAVSGVQPNQYGIYNGATWDPIPLQLVYLSSVGPPANPSVGDWWQNTSAATVSGVAPNAHAFWSGSSWVTPGASGTTGDVYTSAAAAPATPKVGDWFNNTSAATVAGVPAGGTGFWSGSSWIVVLGGAGPASVLYTSATTAPASPKVGDWFNNTSAATVAGVPAGGTAFWSGSSWVVVLGGAGPASVLYTSATAAPASPKVGDWFNNTDTVTVAGVAPGGTAFWSGSSWVTPAASGAAYTSAITAPATPKVGDWFNNTSAATVAGVPASGTAFWSGSSWIVVSTYPGVQYTAAATAPTTPRIGDWWRNSSAAAVSGVPAGAHAFWTGALWSPVGTVINGGNSYGAPMSIGSNDAQPLQLRVNNTVAGNYDTAGKFAFGSTAPTVSVDASTKTDAIAIPTGTTAQRPAAPAGNNVRYNSTTGRYEGYNPAEAMWEPLTSKKTTLAAGTITPDLATSDIIDVSMTANSTMAAPTAVTVGRHIQFVLRQDATGGRTMAWNAAYKFSGGTAPTLSAANKVDILVGYVISATDIKMSSPALNT